MLKLDLTKLRKVNEKVEAPSELKVEFKKFLKENGFIFKVFKDYDAARLPKSDIFFIRLYSTRFKVYPVGNWDSWESNTVYYKEAFRRIKNGESILTIIFNNIN